MVVNYAKDPDAAGSTGNFSQAGGAPAANTASIATDLYHHGTSALKKQITTANQSGATVQTVNLTVSTQEILAWSFWIYSTRAGQIIPYADAAKVSDSSYAGCTGSPSPVSIPANVWTKVAATCTFSQDSTSIRVGGYNLEVQPGDTLWFDEFMVTKGSVTSYADGNSSNWVWNGTPNSSSSTGPAL